jgi:cytochrome c-type biogenesis protein CcmH/NrfG
LLEEVETPVAAQSGSDAGDVEETLRLLQKVLDNEGPSTKLVEELQNAAERHPDSPGLLRLLGDAYMQMGEVDKAIATYRRGFDHL